MSKNGFYYEYDCAIECEQMHALKHIYSEIHACMCVHVCLFIIILHFVRGHLIATPIRGCVETRVAAVTVLQTLSPAPSD